MPPRRRFSKSNRVPDHEERLALVVGTPGRLIHEYGDLETARRRWEQVKSFVRTNRGTRPGAYWTLEGPPHLVEPRAFRDAVDAKDAVARWRELHDTRRCWLAERRLD